MKDNIFYDEIARKTLGFEEDEILEYDEVVERYIWTLASYAVELEDEVFLGEEIFQNLNYSLYYCTGFIFSDYTDDYFLDDILKRMEENEHYDLLIKASSLVVDRFIKSGMEEEGSSIGIALYAVGNAIYDYEKSLENIDTNILS